MEWSGVVMGVSNGNECGSQVAGKGSWPAKDAERKIEPRLLYTLNGSFSEQFVIKIGDCGISGCIVPIIVRKNAGGELMSVAPTKERDDVS